MTAVAEPRPRATTAVAEPPNPKAGKSFWMRAADAGGGMSIAKVSFLSELTRRLESIKKSLDLIYTINYLS